MGGLGFRLVVHELMSAFQLLGRTQIGRGRPLTAPVAITSPGDAASLAQPPSIGTWLARSARPYWLLWLGMAALAVPTMASVMRLSWSQEQGAHGPIVLATGLWLIVRLWRDVYPLARPGSPAITIALLIPTLLVYALARISGIIELEGFAMYGTLLAVLYHSAGGALMRAMWFPLLYMLFLFPPPDTLVALLTQPLKIWVSEAAVNTLYAIGYPVAGSGVTIHVGQYELLVAAACAGLNSMISLTAISLFYVYIRHNANWRYAALLVLAIIPIAILANLIRVLLLILITYHFGDAAAQGFIHNFAGVTMFAASLLGIMAVDGLATPLRRRLARRSEG
jgi:exosortase